MRRKWTIFFIPLLFVAQAGVAQDEHNIVGPGAASCEAMLNKVAEAPVAQMLFVAWAQGYLSGLNMVRLSNAQPAVPIGDATTLFERISGYCEQNPQDSVTDATSAFYATLLSGQDDRWMPNDAGRTPSGQGQPLPRQPDRRTQRPNP